MTFLFSLTILISLGLLGSCYVVDDENGYYSSWRSSSDGPQLNQWPELISPNSFNPFWQNFNLFNWIRPQPEIQQENHELKTMRNRQLVLYNMLRCMLEENDKEPCKKILRNSNTLFKEYNEILGLETEINRPVVIKSTMWHIKPVQIIPKSLESVAPAVQRELAPEAKTAVPVEPVVREKPVSDAVELSIPQEKPVQDVAPPVPVEEPVKVEPQMEQSVSIVEKDLVEKVEPVVLEQKPAETETKAADVPQN